MIVPSKRTALVLALAAPMVLLGFLMAGVVDVLLLANAIVLGLVIVDGRLAPGPDRVTVTRHAPESFSVGRRTAFTYRWQNDASRRASLWIRETRPDLLEGVQSVRRLTILPDHPVREELSVHGARRGRETGGWLAVRSTGPLGLAHRQWRVELPWNATVYPTLPASRLKASIAEAVQRREAGLRSIRWLGEGRQFESLREWVVGDDTRHIDWKATARRRKYITRQFEEERRQQVLLVLDAGRLLTETIGGESRMEYVVRAALWLAYAANYHDDNVGVMVFSDEVHHYVSPQRGRRGLRQVLEVLAVVQPKLVEPDYPAAFRYLAVRNRKRALTVFFTDVIDRIASEAMVANVASLRPRHLPLVVTLRNPVLDATATARPTDVGDAYRKAAAEELLSARSEALLQMRHAGALLLDVHPANAARAVVDQYLELKRRGRL